MSANNMAQTFASHVFSVPSSQAACTVIQAIQPNGTLDGSGQPS